MYPFHMVKTGKLAYITAIKKAFAFLHLRTLRVDKLRVAVTNQRAEVEAVVYVRGEKSHK